MPIDYTYESNGAYALAGQRAGQAQAQKLEDQRAFEQLLQVARLQQQGNQFDDTLGLRQQQQDFNQLQANRNFNYQVGSDQLNRQQRGNEIQARALQDERDFQQQMLQDQQRQGFAQDNYKLQDQLLQQRSLGNMALQRQEMEEQNSFDVAEQMSEQASDVLMEYRKIPNLSDDAKGLLAEHSTKIRQLQGRRGSMRPHQFAEAMGQMLQDLEKERIGEMTVNPPTIAELKKNGQWEEDEEKVVTFDQNGAPKISFKPKTTAEEPKRKTPLGEMPLTEYVSIVEKAMNMATTQLKNDREPPSFAKIKERAREIMEEMAGGPVPSDGSKADGSKQDSSAPPQQQQAPPAAAPDQSQLPPVPIEEDIPVFEANRLKQVMADPSFSGYFRTENGRLVYKTPDGRLLTDIE